jgi:hypothetical protein
VDPPKAARFTEVPLSCYGFFNKEFFYVIGFAADRESWSFCTSRLADQSAKVDPSRLSDALLHIVPFCEGPNQKSEGFAKEKQKT